MPRLPSLLSIALASALISSGSSAAELTGTLKKINDSGTITLGHRDSSIPFSYFGDKPRQPVGYAHDLQLKIVDAIKQKLSKPNLRIRYTLITSQSRIPLVQNGTVDIECGSTTNNLERQRQVDFSVGIFEVGTRLLTLKTSGINDFSDLNGKNVVTTAGTTSERLLKAMNSNNKMAMQVISAKDHGESFMMLESGRAMAFMLDDALLAGEMAKAKQPEKWAVVGKPQSYEIYGCMMRKGDTPFKQLVDKALSETFASGEIESIYSKWFMQPIPPNGLNLNFPMSEELKQLLANPTDHFAGQQ